MAMIGLHVRNLALLLSAGGLAFAVPAAAFPVYEADPKLTRSLEIGASAYGDDDDDYDRWDRRDRRDRYDRRYARQSNEYRDRRVWRGDDGRTYCRKSDGTTGLLIGGAAGALVGREIAGRNGDRTLGAILGAAGGALLGKKIDSRTRCN